MAPSGDSSPYDDVMKIKRKKNAYKTPIRKMEEKRGKYKIKEENLKKATKLVNEGVTVRAAAANYNLSKSTLHDFIKKGDKKRFQAFKGYISKVLSKDEEELVKGLAKKRADLGCGLSYGQLQTVLQEVLQRLTKRDSTRTSGYEESNHLPNMSYVYRLCKRVNLVLRSTMEITKGRAIVSQEDIEAWQEDVEKIMKKPGVLECFSDPRRIFNQVCINSIGIFQEFMLNQDETSIELGTAKRRVLAEKGTKVKDINSLPQINKLHRSSTLYPVGHVTT